MYMYIGYMRGTLIVKEITRQIYISIDFIYLLTFFLSNVLYSRLDEL